MRNSLEFNTKDMTLFYTSNFQGCSVDSSMIKRRTYQRYSQPCISNATAAHTFPNTKKQLHESRNEKELGPLLVSI